MAPLPKPLAISTVLTDIATGIGNAASLLPDKSRSAVGAMAVRSAKVHVEFEMAQAVSTGSSFVGVGMKSASFGITTTREAVEERQINRGVIDLEIVAIEDSSLRAAPQEAPDGGRRAAIGTMIDLLKSPPARALLSAARAKQLDAILAEAERLVAEGKLDEAAAVLARGQALIQPAPAALPVGIVTSPAVRPGRTPSPRPSPPAAAPGSPPPAAVGVATTPVARPARRPAVRTPGRVAVPPPAPAPTTPTTPRGRGRPRRPGGGT